MNHQILWHTQSWHGKTSVENNTVYLNCLTIYPLLPLLQALASKRSFSISLYCEKNCKNKNIYRLSYFDFSSGELNKKLVFGLTEITSFLKYAQYLKYGCNFIQGKYIGWKSIFVRCHWTIFIRVSEASSLTLFPDVFNLSINPCKNKRGKRRRLPEWKH